MYIYLSINIYIYVYIYIHNIFYKYVKICKYVYHEYIAKGMYIMKAEHTKKNIFDAKFHEIPR